MMAKALFAFGKDLQTCPPQAIIFSDWPIF
jgi:hypothetical protein